MAIQLSQIIKNWVPENSKVIDFGCGNGSLLDELIIDKNILGYGVEINDLKIAECIQKGVPVIKQDIDKGINEFISSNFDLSIMARSIQCLKNPDLALNEMLQISKRCVVTVPNLGYWRCRINLASGKMPVTPELPSSWYETENIHLCTIKDFEELCNKLDLLIVEKLYLNNNLKESVLTKLLPNLFAAEGVYLIERQ